MYRRRCHQKTFSNILTRTSMTQKGKYYWKFFLKKQGFHGLGPNYGREIRTLDLLKMIAYNRQNFI